MKLYYSPFAYSQAAHIVIKEAGLDVELLAVDLKSKRVEDGSDFNKINPKGQVATLVLDDGEILTEGPAILLYLAGQAPQSDLMPKPESIEHYRTIEWLSYVSSELHKRLFYIIFWTDAHQANAAREAAPEKLIFLSNHLENRSHLVDETFTVADAYLTWWLGLAPQAGLPLDAYPILTAYLQRQQARDSVREANEFETRKIRDGS